MIRTQIKTQWTASQLLLTAGILVPISFMSWLLIADPGPTKVILEAVSHGGQHSQELLDLAAWLKNAKKPQAAFCALKAASGYPHIATMAQLAILARAVEDASGTDTSGTDTSMLALHGLQMAERLCTTCNSDADRISLASSANTFASVVLANRLQGEFGRKPAPTAQTCVAIIQWWQHAAVTMPGLSDGESLSYVDLLYVAECASLKLKLPDAPGLLVRLMYSARKQPTLQRKVIETFLDSTTIFSNKEEWHRFLSATLQAPHQDMLFSLVYHALEANSPNLKVEPLLESIVLEQKTPRSAELLQPLTRACKRLSTNKRLELCKLILESRAEPSGGKGLSRVMKLSEAYYLASANKYVEEVECFQQLTRGVHRFVQEASDDELNNAVRWLFDGHYRLPSDVADDLCFGWNKRTSKNATAKSILLNTPVDHVRDPDKPLILSLRGLLLGYNNYYSAGAELLKKAEQSVTDESYGWVKMIVPWRQTQFEALGPDPTRMKHYAEKALKEAVVLKDKAKEGSIRALIVQADLLRDKSDFLNGKMTFPALVSKTANIATSSQLAAVVLSALDTMLQTNSQAKAKKLSDESLYLADDKSVDAEMRIGILLRAAHLSSQNGSTESVQTKRTLLTRARELSSKNGFTRLEQECIDSLSHL